ncbi:MAG: hypothetical protein ACXW2F_07750 [Thermoanaerobaculia bacterium]
MRNVLLVIMLGAAIHAGDEQALPTRPVPPTGFGEVATTRTVDPQPPGKPPTASPEPCIRPRRDTARVWRETARALVELARVATR